MTDDDIIRIQYVHIEYEDDPFDSRKPSISCKDSDTIQNWFAEFCQNEKPAATEVEYHFVILKIRKCYALKLVGLSRQEETQAGQSRMLLQNFDPHSTEYPLSAKPFKALSLDAIAEKIEKELLEICTKGSQNALPLFEKVERLSIKFDSRNPIILK